MFRLVAPSLLIILLAAVPLQAATPPKPPADFKPFLYEYTAEQLAEKFSADQMKRAAVELKELQDINERGPWKPTWDSLDKHQAPEWFLDAKLGIMLNWGMHSVPAWDRKREGAMYPDAYGCAMYVDPVVRAHHAQQWDAGFQWDDFLPMFQAEKYDPEGLVKLFKDSGARYLITMSKHHDGVAWWDSKWTRRNFAQMGPKRDLLSPLIAAAHKEDLKVVLYFCYEEWATAVLGENDKPCHRLWNWGQYAGLHPLTPESRRRVSGNIPVKNYYDQYMTPLVKEMIDRFQPDGLWMDGEWATPAETLRSRELAAYFYNKTQGRKDVLVNDRYGQGTRDHHGDVFCSEYNTTQSYGHAWEECQGISQSFAYHREDNEASLGPPERLIHRFIDIVSRNGNLAIIGGPDASGVYPENVLQRLKAMGAWLKVNGEAIYATRPLPPHQEGSVRYTRSKDSQFAYAICTQWPGRSLTLKGIRAAENAEVRMLGVARPLVWQQDAQGLVIKVPEPLQDEQARPCRHAWAIKIPIVRGGRPHDQVGRLTALPASRPPLAPSALRSLPLGAVKPAGWLRKQMELQAAGLSGHLDEFWNPKEFAGSASAWLGGPGEAWEMTPYYLDGILPLAYQLDDARLLEKATRRIEWALGSQRSDGQFGPRSNEDWWARMPVLKALAYYYEATGDPRVPQMLTKYFHYQLENLPKRPLAKTSVWAHARGQDNMMVVHWLYNLTGDPRLLKLSDLLRRQTLDWIATLAPQEIPGGFGEPWKKAMGMATHGVNAAMGVKFPAVCWERSGDPADRAAARRAVENLLKYHGQPFGLFSCDEHLHGTSPIRGTELCTVVEYMLSLEENVRVLGDCFFADNLECVAYNALPAAIKPDMWGQQYVQQVNQVPASRVKPESCKALWIDVEADSRTYGPGPCFYCCLVNFHQGWPKLVKHLVMATTDGGVATVAYGPCTAEVRVADDVALRLVETTDYPMGEKITLKMGLAREARFPLLLRIPRWATEARITVNGRPQPSPTPGGFHRIEQVFRDGDTVELELPMRVRVSAGHQGLVSVYRGPLLFGLKIGEQWHKYRGEDPHAFWEVHPTTPWNYALVLDRANPAASFQVETSSAAGRPFKDGVPPVQLKAKARRLPQWTMDKECPAVIAAEQPSTEPIEEITLVPYGYSNIRIAAFPIVR